MMDQDRFWAIIAESRKRTERRKVTKSRSFLDIQLKELTPILRQLSPEDLIAYERRFSYYLDMAYRWDLWGAAYLLFGGCGDDGFLDFRSTLVSLGKEMFFQILDDPDSLAELVSRPEVPFLCTEGFQYVAMRVYTEKTGQDRMPEPERKRPWPYEPKGRNFDFDDEEVMRRKYPRLMARSSNEDKEEAPESNSAYFRRLFAERPEALASRNNDELLIQFSRDHPGQEVGPSIRQALANVKALLRRKKPLE
jgi:hypothetical protein